MGVTRAVGTEDRTNSATDEVAALTHELVEALTAIGNYLTVAHNMLAPESPLTAETCRDIVEKGLTQYARATVVARRLGEAIRRENREDDNDR